MTGRYRIHLRQNESMASVHSATQNIKGTKVGFMSKSILTFLLSCTLTITGDNKSIVCCNICTRRVFQSQELRYNFWDTNDAIGAFFKFINWSGWEKNQQRLYSCLQSFIINNALPVLMQRLRPPFTNTPQHRVTTFSHNVRLSGGESALLLYHTLTWAY